MSTGEGFPSDGFMLTYSCTRTIGVFLWLKRNSIVYLREPPTESAVPQGELRDAPYLNVHGETERDLRYLIQPIVYSP